MQAKIELLQLKERLQKQIDVLASEMSTVDKAIELIEREHSSTASGIAPQNKQFRKLGLADTCRQIVGSDWLTPSEVRARMIQGGYKHEDAAKLLSAIFATLKRLGTKELEGRKIDGKLRYRKRQSATALTAVEAA
jgi:hypothetical protein